MGEDDHLDQQQVHRRDRKAAGRRRAGPITEVAQMWAADARYEVRRGRRRYRARALGLSVRDSRHLSQRIVPQAQTAMAATASKIAEPHVAGNHPNVAISPMIAAGTTRPRPTCVHVRATAARRELSSLRSIVVRYVTRSRSDGSQFRDFPSRACKLAWYQGTCVNGGLIPS